MSNSDDRWVCTQLWAERYPRECEGCGRPYVRQFTYLGWHMHLHARTLTCERPGCGHEWIQPEDAQLVPVLRRCTDGRCPTWREAEPVRPVFPASDAG